MMFLLERNKIGFCWLFKDVLRLASDEIGSEKIKMVMRRCGQARTRTKAWTHITFLYINF